MRRSRDNNFLARCLDLREPFPGPALVLIAMTLSAWVPSAFGATIRETVSFSAGDLSIVSTPHGARYTLKDCPSSNQPGEPSVPFRSVFITVPEGQRVTSVQVDPAETYDLGFKPVPMRSVSAAPVSQPVWDGQSPYPQAPFDVGSVGWMRGIALQEIVLWPIQWNPITGRTSLVTRYEILVETEAGPPPPGTWHPVRRGTPAEGRFDVVVRSLALNPEDVPRPRLERRLKPLDSGATPFSPRFRPSPDGSPVDFVIITSQALAPHFQPLADWKTQSGILSVVRTTE